MQLLNVGVYPIYLPADRAPVPFGDPIEGVTVTSASPGVVTAPGEYVPTNGDQVSLTFLAGGSIPTGLTAATPYYVVAATQASGLWTFELSATKGGSAINTTGTGGSLVLHLLSGETDGVTLPFKPGYTVLAENNSAGTLVIQGANDLNAGVGPPQGPGSWTTLPSNLGVAGAGSLTAGSQALLLLAYDWIRCSTNGNISLMQN